mgnify:CR=1 FL=1
MLWTVFFHEVSVDKYLRIWIIFCPIILLGHLIPAKADSLIKLRDAGLFLLTGGAIGKTLGSVISREPLYFIYFAWLVPALIVVILHYSPSKNDRYTNQ